MNKRNKNYPDVLGEIVKDYTKTLKHEIKQLRIRIGELKHYNSLMEEELEKVQKERNNLQAKNGELFRRLSEFQTVQINIDSEKQED